MRLRDRLRSVSVLLALWYALVLLATFIVFGSATYLFLSDELLATLDDNIATELEWTSNILSFEMRKAAGEGMVDSVAASIRDLLDIHFALNPRNYIVLVTYGDSVVLYESYNRQRELLSPAEIGSEHPYFTTLPDRQYDRIRVAAIRTPEVTIQVAYPFRWIRIALDHTARVFYLLIPVAVLFSFTGGVLMASVALRPVRHITKTARRITAESLGERIPERDVDDELGVLIKTINVMIGRLEVSFNEMKNFSLEVAHELKTPLTILKGETELALARPPEGEELQALLGSFLEETVRLSRIVEDLLTVSKADAGQLSLHSDRVEMQSLIAEIAEDAVLLADTKGISVSLAANDPCTVSGDAQRLRQVFRNLLSNAVQYSDRGSPVVLSSSVLNRVVQVSIRDSGMGIDPEDLGRIFDRLYRSSAARERNKGGSGLGLSIAQRIVRLHGGDIAVRSERGTGSTFTVSLPVAGE